MDSILFVCLGNICRSPLAEGVFRAGLAGTPWEGRIEVASAGIGDWHVGGPPDPRAIAVAARYGVDISGLRARQIADEDFFRFGRILCADRSNLDRLRHRVPAGATARLGLILAEAGIDPRGEVPDPYFGDESGFEQVYRLLADASGRLIRQLRQTPGASTYGESP